MNELRWANFYLLVSAAAATLIGLLFVVILLGAERIVQDDTAKIRMYLTPTVLDFASVLLLSALLTFPNHTRITAPLCIYLVGVAGLVYSGSFLIGQRHKKHYYRLQDRIVYAMLSGCGLRSSSVWGGVALPSRRCRLSLSWTEPSELIRRILDPYTRVFVDADGLDSTLGFYEALLDAKQSLRFVHPEAGLTLAAVSSPRLSVLIVSGSPEHRLAFKATRVTIRVEALEVAIAILLKVGAAQLEPIQATPVGLKIRFQHLDGLICGIFENNISGLIATNLRLKESSTSCRDPR